MRYFTCLLSSLCFCLLGDLDTSLMNQQIFIICLHGARYCSRCGVCGSEHDPVHALAEMRLQGSSNQTQR